MIHYIKDIARQIKSAEGIKSPIDKPDEFVMSHIDWLKERIKVGKSYVDFLDYLGLNYKESDCAEVGKTEIDSVVLPFETTIITPDYLMKKDESRIILHGDIDVVDSTPILQIHLYGKETGITRTVPSDVIRTYMTQNPYSFSSIRGWHDLHNAGYNDVILGIYGSMHDKDIVEKVKELKAFREKLTDDEYIEDYASVNDGYFYVIASERSIKRPVMIRTRIR